MRRYAEPVLVLESAVTLPSECVSLNQPGFTAVPFQSKNFDSSPDAANAVLFQSAVYEATSRAGHPNMIRNRGAGGCGNAHVVIFRRLPVR